MMGARWYCSLKFYVKMLYIVIAKLTSTCPHLNQIQLSAIPVDYIHVTARAISSFLTLPYHFSLFRYIRYVSQIVWEPRYLPHKKPLFLKTVTMSPVPLFNKAKYEVYCYISLSFMLHTL